MSSDQFGTPVLLHCIYCSLEGFHCAELVYGPDLQTHHITLEKAPDGIDEHMPEYPVLDEDPKLHN